MFESLLSLFSTERELPEADREHVLGALLVRMARADSAYLFEEIEEIDRILARRNDLNPVEAAKMRADCEILEGTLPSTEELSRRIADERSETARETMVIDLWHVLIADGSRHENEERILEQAGAIFGIAPERARMLKGLDLAEQTEPKRTAKGYWIAHGRVDDIEAYDLYRAANAAPLAEYGGRFLVRGGERELVEGDAKPRTVVIEFPSYQAALACYQSEAYQAALKLREGISESDLVIAEGYAP
ncbi:MAG: DUF1330 domain-containing protein [Shimia sp.]